MASSVLQIGYYPTLLQTRQLMLEQNGYQVTSVLGNEQGMAVAPSQRFDVIVIGFSDTHAMRSGMVRWLKQHLPETPVVALLANTSETFTDADCATLSEDPAVWLATVRRVCLKV